MRRRWIVTLLLASLSVTFLAASIEFNHFQLTLQLYERIVRPIISAIFT